MSRAEYQQDRYELGKSPLPLSLFCNGCGKPFKPVRRGHHFCARSCRQRVVMRARRVASRDRTRGGGLMNLEIV